MLSSDKSPNFTKTDVENKKCIGCDHPYFKDKVIFGTPEEYCCTDNVDVDRQTVLHDCYTVTDCKMYAFQRLDQDSTDKNTLTIAGAVSSSIGVLTILILFIRLIWRIVRRRR